MVYVDETRCTGCGLCADVCPTGAISVVDGVAKVEQSGLWEYAHAAGTGDIAGGSEKMTPEDLIAALDGLPEESVHCAELAVNTLREAIANGRANDRSEEPDDR